MPLPQQLDIYTVTIQVSVIPKCFLLRNLANSAHERLLDKKIRRLEFVDEVPKSLSGKILRRVLVEQERANLA